MDPHPDDPFFPSLTAMVGYLSLLDESGEDFPAEARREMLAEANRQARHMARLVSDLVMLARGDHRHVPLEIAETTVSDLITGALRGVHLGQTRIEESFEGARMTVESSGPPPAERPRHLDLVPFLDLAVRLGRLTVDVHLAPLAGLLGFRPGLVEAGYVEPHIQPHRSD